MPDHHVPTSGVSSSDPWRNPFSWRDWRRFIVPVIALACVALGGYLGETAGRDWEGFGRITGQRIGSWIGFGMGIIVAVSLAMLLGRVQNVYRTGDMLKFVAVWAILIVASTVAAVFGEATVGKPGGAFAFCGPLVIAVAYVSWGKMAKQRREPNSSDKPGSI